MNEINQAIILAAGEGQRLRPFTLTKPKVMLPVGSKPLLQYTLEAMAENGLRDIIMVVGYKREQIQDFFGSGDQLGVKITYLVQEQQLGTAHALHQARNVAATRFVVVSGDNFIEPSTIRGLLEKGPNSILVAEQKPLPQHGLVQVEEGQVKTILQVSGDTESGLINTGTYCLTNEVFEFTGEAMDLPAALQSMLERGHYCLIVNVKGAWFDVAYPWDLLTLNDMALRRISPVVGGIVERGVSIRGPVWVGKDTVLHSNSYIVGPAFIDENCEIGPSVCVLPSTRIGKNVVVSPFSMIRNSIINDDVSIGPGCSIIDSVIDRGCDLGGHFSATSAEAEIKVDGEFHQAKVGAMIGEACDIGEQVVAQPGTMIGVHCRIRSLKVISGRIPDGSLVM